MEVKDLKQDAHNYRKHSKENKRKIKKSIDECGYGRSVVVDADGVLIAGNGVHSVTDENTKVRVIETDGTELVVVKRTDLHEGDEKRKKLAAADNATADNVEWDFDNLLDDFDMPELEDMGIEVPTFDEEDNDKTEQKNARLIDKFIVPPFSILDTRQGYWQDRKKQWLDIGLKSEQGRNENLICDSQIKDYIKTSLKTYAPSTSVFDPVLCEICYRWFNIDRGFVYDPFAGGSVRGVVSEMLGYKYIGIDLRQEQINANIENAKCIGVLPKWICDDSTNVDAHLKNESVDMIFSCPPYADLEVYSDNPRDLSNMSHDEFFKAYRVIIDKACNKLKEDRFAIFVVGDVRDNKGAYINFVDYTKKCFNDCGLVTYNEMILLEQIGSGAIRSGRTFNSLRKVIKVHQNVLVFYKGEIKNIKNNFKHLDFSSLEENDKDNE